MRQLFFLIAIFSLAVNFCGCKSKKNATTSTTKTTEVITDKIHTYRLIASFISKGAGVNRTKVEALMNIVEKHPKKPVYEKISWGREGEMDFCFQLNEMKASEQTAFINQIKKELNEGDMVFITENTECSHQRR